MGLASCYEEYLDRQNDAFYEKGLALVGALVATSTNLAADGSRGCKHVFKAMLQLKIEAQGLVQDAPTQLPWLPAKPAPRGFRKIDLD